LDQVPVPLGSSNTGSARKKGLDGPLFPLHMCWRPSASAASGPP